MTAVSPERAAYEEFRRAFPTEDWGPWELLPAEDRQGWRRVADAGAGASPELAGALARITAAEQFCRALLAPQPPGAEHSGLVKTVARAVLSYLGAAPVASPETSASVITRVPGGTSG